MDKAKFNSRMARPKYSKGGYIKKVANRKYFDDGGIAQNSVGPGAVQSGGTSTNTQGIGGISSALGMNAQSANINSGTNQAQLGNAYTGTQNAINSQIGLTNTLNPQAATGVGNQNAVAQQELAMTQGAGPNPAQNQLAQATGTNVANQAALMAGQRGASGNVGLAARNIGQQGATTQEQAAGQAATLQAQQQIAAQQNLANLSNQQIAQTQGANTALSTAQQNEQNILQNANTSYNNAAVGMQSNINSNNASTNSNILGGITSGLSSGLSAVGLAKGGEVNAHSKHKLDFVHKMTHLGLKHFDEGGDVGSYTQSEPSSGPSVAPAGTQAPIQWGGGGGGGKGGGGGGLAMLAALSDGGEVNPPPPPPPQINHDQAQTIQDISRKAFNYAGGGQISSNPLIGAITGVPAQAGSYGQYTSSAASAGPNIAGAGSQSPVYSPSKSKGKKPDASDPLAARQSDISNQNAQMMAGPSTMGPDASISQQNADMMAGPSGVAQPAFNPNVQGTINPDETNQTISQGDTNYSNEAHGGEINYHDHFSNYFGGGKAKEVEAMVSPGERYWEPEEVEQIKHGADPSKLGRIFPGKDKVPGKDSLKNDTVPTKLREGGIVNPLHVEKTKNPDKMRLFVLKSLRATGRHMKKPQGVS